MQAIASAVIIKDLMYMIFSVLKFFLYCKAKQQTKNSITILLGDDLNSNGVVL